MTPNTAKRSTLSGDLIVLFAIVLVDVLVHIVFSGQYGFHRDELDIVMNAPTSWIRATSLTRP